MERAISLKTERLNNVDVFKGTGRLIRLVLRRDRVKLPIWIILTVAMVAASAPALQSAYPGITERVTYATTTASSVVGKIMGGAIDGPELGSILMIETFLFTAMLLAFMSVFLITRHTRQNEETGSAELISSGVVGRFAPLSAALIVAVAANILIAFLIFLSLLPVSEISSNGAMYFSLALAAVGISFSVIGAICVQLTDYARGANALGSTIIGIMFVVRGIGDGLGNVSADGFSSSSHWLSWLSPFGWGSMVHPFTQPASWVFGLFAIFCVSLTGLAFVLLEHRDVGSGIFPSRAGRPEARKRLLSIYGLAWRIQKGALLGWSIAFILLGLMFGVMAKEFEKVFSENEFAQEFFAAGGSGDFTDVFFAALLGFTTVFAAGYCVQAMMKMKAEESSMRLESLLGTAVGRVKWMFSHVSIAIAGSSFVVFLVGLGMAISHSIVSDVSFAAASDLITASLVQIPAIALFGGVIALIFGRLPSLTVPLAWGFFTFCLLIGQFAALLKLPDWTINLSPFSHTPQAPAASINTEPMIIMAALGIVALVISHMLFKGRDIATN
jgi:ABC-2 type transport system permease protein